MTTVVLCGMPDEKRVLTEALPGIQILSGTDKLELFRLVPPECTVIVSMGLCGGLGPGPAVGDIVMATMLFDKEGGADYPDIFWANKVKRLAISAGISVRPCRYYSSGLMGEADTVEQRAVIFQRFRALAIDDESRFVAAFAKRRQISFGVLRSVSDDYTMTLPQEARGNIMNPDGSPNIGYLMATLKIQDVPQLLQIAKDYNKSLDTLEIIARAVAPIFAP